MRLICRHQKLLYQEEKDEPDDLIEIDDTVIKQSIENFHGIFFNKK